MRYLTDIRNLVLFYIDNRIVRVSPLIGYKI